MRTAKKHHIEVTAELLSLVDEFICNVAVDDRLAAAMAHNGAIIKRKRAVAAAKVAAKNSDS
ncbi:MAG: hypothetical protein ABW022_18870 [Actinoplanes sp.]